MRSSKTKMEKLYTNPKRIKYPYKNRYRKRMMLKPFEEPNRRDFRVVKPKKTGGVLKQVWNYVKIYLETTSMHGLAYIVKKELIWCEKLVWLFIILMCHVSCILIAHQSLNRFQYKSTVMGVERDYHYWNTSVPSITVCPFDQIDDEVFEKYCRDQNVTDKVAKRELRNFLRKFANSTYYNFEDIPIYATVDSTLEFLGITPQKYMELIYNLTSSKTTIYAHEGSTPILSRQILTEFGICYLANTALDIRYSAEYAIFGRYPKLDFNYSLGKNVSQGSYFDVDMTIDFFGFSAKTFISYIHGVEEVIRVENNFDVLSDAVQYIASSKEIITDLNFENEVTIAQRMCRFQHETNLKHFPIYTKNLCVQECRLNLALKLCGCIPHFYPNRMTSIPVCHYKVLRDCFPPLKSFLLKLHRVQNGKKEVINCNCLQNCNDSLVIIENAAIFSGLSLVFGDTVGVRLIVNSWPRQRIKRQVVFTFVDLLVSFGSNAGLLLGFTILSAVELIYFFTLRLVFHLRNYKIK